MWNEPTHKVWFLFNKRIKGRKFHFMHGSMAWELQIGRQVFMLRYRNVKWNHARFRHWNDSFGKV